MEFGELAKVMDLKELSELGEFKKLLELVKVVKLGELVELKARNIKRSFHFESTYFLFLLLDLG